MHASLRLAIAALITIGLAACNEEDLAAAQPSVKQPIVSAPPASAPAPSQSAPDPVTDPISSLPEAPARPAEAEPKRVTLSWIAPATRENGAGLEFEEIKGYEIYYCKDACSAADPSETLSAAADLTEMDITLGESGVWTFTIVVIDRDNLKSALSNDVAVDLT